MVDAAEVPFTAATLKETLVGANGVLRRNQVPPPDADLERLATKLNWVRRHFQVMLDMGNDNQNQLEQVHQAVRILETYFNRRRALLEPGPYRPLSQEVCDSESRLAAKYDCFAAALRAHDFPLFMDVTVLPQVFDWHDLAEQIAFCFEEAMHQSRVPNSFGRSSNTGPIPRFVSSVIPKITGESPSVGAVGKCLKEKTKLRRQVGTDSK